MILLQIYLLLTPLFLSPVGTQDTRCQSHKYQPGICAVETVWLSSLTVVERRDAELHRPEILFCFGCWGWNSGPVPGKQTLYH